MFSYCECEYVNLFSIDQICLGHTIYLPPAKEVCEGYVFTPVCQSFCSQGGAGVHGCRGGMHGCQGACMVVGGGVHGFGGMHGCWGGMCGCRGVCMVAGVCVVVGGACVVMRDMCGCGGMHGCRGVCMVVGGACVVAGQVCVGYNEIRSMSRQYASYWDAFLSCKSLRSRKPFVLAKPSNFRMHRRHHCLLIAINKNNHEAD